MVLLNYLSICYPSMPDKIKINRQLNTTNQPNQPPPDPTSQLQPKNLVKPKQNQRHHIRSKTTNNLHNRSFIEPLKSSKTNDNPCRRYQNSQQSVAAQQIVTLVWSSRFGHPLIIPMAIGAQILVRVRESARERDA